MKLFHMYDGYKETVNRKEKCKYLLEKNVSNLTNQQNVIKTSMGHNFLKIC